MTCLKGKATTLAETACVGKFL